MSPQARKTKIEALLKREGIPFLPSLPCLESEAATKLRSAEEVGIRITCLYGVVGYAFERRSDPVKEYLKQHDLWVHLTPEELAFLREKSPRPQDFINF